MQIEAKKKKPIHSTRATFREPIVTPKEKVKNRITTKRLQNKTSKADYRRQKKVVASTLGPEAFRPTIPGRGLICVPLSL